MQIDIDLVASRRRKGKSPQAVIDITTTPLRGRTLGDNPTITITSPNDDHQLVHGSSITANNDSQMYISAGSQRLAILPVLNAPDGPEGQTNQQDKEDFANDQDGHQHEREQKISKNFPKDDGDRLEGERKVTKNDRDDHHQLKHGGVIVTKDSSKGSEFHSRHAQTDSQGSSTDKERHRGRDGNSSDDDHPKPKRKLTMHCVALVWILAFLLTAALAIAALATDYWSTLEHVQTGIEHDFGLWESYEPRTPSCQTSDIVSATMEAEYANFHVDLVSGFIIVGIILDGVSLVLGIFVWLARRKGKERHWAWSIPTIVAVLLAGDFILAACAVYIWDLEHVPRRRKAVEDSNCATFLLNVDISVHSRDSLYLALAAACLCFVKGLLFGLIAHKIKSAQAEESKDKSVRKRRSKKIDNPIEEQQES